MTPPRRRGPAAGACCRGHAARGLGPPAPAFLATALLLVLAAARGASAARCYASLSAADFPHCSLLSPSFALHWAVRGGNVTLGMNADTGGGPDAWLAVALSKGGGMIGADMMIVAGGGGPADDNGYGGEEAVPPSDGGGWRVIDAHSLEFAQPLRDAQQDVSLVGQPLSGPNNTVAVVTRRLRTCDPWDEEVVVGVPHGVSWAYGRGYPSKHTARGNSAVVFVPEASGLWGASATNASAATPAGTAAGSAGAGANITSPNAAAAQLFAGTDSAQPAVPGGRRAGPAGGGGIRSAAAAPMVSANGGGGSTDAVAGSPEPILVVDVVMPNVTVPSNVTTNYLCTHVTLPHDRKYHTVGMRPITPSPLIHHMVLFACYRKPPSGSGVYSCLGTTAGPDCSEVYLVWTPGQMGTLLPLTVGLPLGEPDSTHFALQVHYNNPNGLEGVVDASGLQVLYTPQLRQYDAGALTLGQPALVIPPGRPIVTPKPNVCPSTCTSRLRAPVRLLSNMLHMHTLGRAMSTQHIRNGTELPPVGSRRFYNFNFQSRDAVPLDTSILAPGDSLITTCSFDSTSRINFTTYGDSTQSEMCYNFMLYYPRDTNFTFCISLDMMDYLPEMNRVALCGGIAQANIINTALERMQQIQRQRPQDSVDIVGMPEAVPLLQAGAVVSVPPNDSVIVKPYGRQCPDMSYGLPLQEQRELALHALSDDAP